MKRKKKPMIIVPQIVAPQEGFDDSGTSFPDARYFPADIGDVVHSIYTNPGNAAELKTEIQLAIDKIKAHVTPLSPLDIQEQTKIMINGFLGFLEKLGKNTARKTVISYYLVGNILRIVEPKFSSKAEYMRWLRTVFPADRSLESLRQARKIASLHEYALKYSLLGKNRVLELYYMLEQHVDEENHFRSQKDQPLITEGEKKSRIIELEDLLINCGLNEMAELDAVDVKALRTSMDAALTLYRIRKQLALESITDVQISVEQAKMLALYRGLALEWRHIKDVARQLKDPIILNRQEFFDGWVMERLYSDLDTKELEARPMRVRQILASFSHWYGKSKELKKHDLVVLARDAESKKSIKKAYRVIVYLAHKLGISELPEHEYIVGEFDRMLGEDTGK